jgi:3',5'-cyclic AMP phosphodiesterase CpdA
MKWLESQLQIENEIKIVVGHHPLFSYLDYGTENRTFLTERVVPLLEKYRTLAVFGGHDHNLQYSRPRKDSTSYFVSGAGSRLRDGSFSAKSSDEHFYHVVHGFMACSIRRDDSLRVLGIDMYGNIVDKVTVK